MSSAIAELTMQPDFFVPYRRLRKQNVIDLDAYFERTHSDPLPVRRAWQRGARRIVVIRSVPETTTRTSWQQLYESSRLKRALPEKFTRMLEVYDRAYQEALAFIAEPPAGVEIRQIAPATSLASKAFGSRSLEIQADYGIGLRDGMMSLMPGPDSLRKWLVKPRSRERFGSPARDDQATSSTAH